MPTNHQKQQSSDLGPTVASNSRPIDRHNGDRTDQPSVRQGVSAGELPLNWRILESTPLSRGEAVRIMQRTPLKGHVGDARLLRKSSVAILGTGAVGGSVLGQLVRTGVGEVFCVDSDHYGEESFLTQAIPWRQRSQSKAWVQAALAHDANPSVVIRAAVGFAQDLPLSVLRRATVLVVAGDNLELPIWTCQGAAALGKPVVQAAVYPETSTAIVRGYDLTDPAAACARCGLSRLELNARKNRYGCDPFTLRETGKEPTRTVPTICGLAAQLAANEALKWLTGGEQHALRGEEFAFSLLTYRGWRTELPRSETCELPHRRWELVDLDAPFRNVTPSMLAARLGLTGDPGKLQVRSEIPWISMAICGDCGRHNAVRRFARLGSAVGQCRCGGQLSAGPRGARTVVPLDDLRACWDRSIAALGLPDSLAIGMMPEEDWVYFFSPLVAATNAFEPSIGIS